MDHSADVLLQVNTEVELEGEQRDTENESHWRREREGGESRTSGMRDEGCWHRVNDVTQW